MSIRVKFLIFCISLLNIDTFGSTSRYDQVLNSVKSYGQKLGLSVRSLDGKEIVQWNGERLLSPASVAKMVSSACVLDELSPQYQFETVFGYRGQVVAGVLNGDLVIRGSGDPSFVIEHLRESVEKIRALYGIKSIKGSLIFDGSYFSSATMDISKGFDGDEARAFNTSLTAVPLNFNSFSTAVASLEGKTVAAVLPTGSFDATIKNGVKVGDLTEVSLSQPKREEIILSGRIRSEDEPKYFYRSVPDAYFSFAQVFNHLWQEAGGEWQKPQFKLELKSGSLVKLFTHRSQPISRLLMDVNKLSTNFAAEMLTLAAGAQSLGRPATMEKAQSMVRNCWEKFGLSRDRMVMENASGLSRATKMRPSDLTLFLSHLDSVSFYPEYLSSLSVLGKDGTTRKRLGQYAGRGRLKTGSIKGVQTIAGFLFPEKGEPLVFALFAEGLSETRAIEDQVMSLLLGAR